MHCRVLRHPGGRHAGGPRGWNAAFGEKSRRVPPAGVGIRSGPRSRRLTGAGPRSAAPSDPLTLGQLGPLGPPRSDLDCGWRSIFVVFFSIMKTTLMIPDPIYRRLKQRAAAGRRAISSLLAELLDAGLRAEASKRQ